MSFADREPDAGWTVGEGDRQCRADGDVLDAEESYLDAGDAQGVPGDDTLRIGSDVGRVVEAVRGKYRLERVDEREQPGT